MKALIKSASYIFHPLWMPFLGTLFYFTFSPRFFPLPLIKAKLLAIAITTLFIPIVFYYLLKNLGKASSFFLKDVKERRWPLFFYILLLGLNLYQILNVYNYPVLYYFFVGILFSILTAFILAWLKFKVSLHMIGHSGFLMFVIAMSIYFKLNLIYFIALTIVALGLTATSRLQLKAHTVTELFAGFFIGLLPQIIVFNYWL
ncbi:hypothetical protein L1I30_01330 [Gillisia sp. M10.2A]|uniref:PAP2 superfamily protein n=1 Tax=Gillisia lutea TaxID=2909668 RepID=A0ABS9EBM5_9FLAO|nr:hypothetical protein [Gillisia lutea]MCF4100296.1 hypothetical protein [Gillisia lutea]